jgi:hypothetical protein
MPLFSDLPPDFQGVFVPIPDPCELKITAGTRPIPAPPELRFSFLGNEVTLAGYSAQGIRELIAERTELKSSLDAAHKDRDSTRAERDRLKRDLERRNADIDSLIKQRNDWRIESVRNEDRTRAVEAERDELKRELAVKSDDFDSMLAQRDKWRDSSTDFKNRALAAEAEHRETKADLPRLNATIDTLTRARGQMLKERNEYLGLLKTARAEALDERNKTLNVTKERDDALEAEKRAKRDAANLRVRLSYPQSERVTGGAVRVHIERDLYESQRDKAIRELKQSEEKWEKERAGLKAQIGDLTARISNLRHENVSTRNSLRDHITAANRTRQKDAEECALVLAQAEVRHNNDIADILTQRDKAQADAKGYQEVAERFEVDAKLVNDYKDAVERAGHAYAEERAQKLREMRLATEARAEA